MRCEKYERGRFREERSWLKLEAQNLDKILLSLVSILLVLTLLVTSITSQITKKRPNNLDPPN